MTDPNIDVPGLVRIASGALAAQISPLGAELQSLRDEAGRELLWDGDPAWWTGRAPILFPVIGVVANGVIRVDGRDYPMPKHGFVRHRPLALVAHDAASARFRLEADDATRAAYPFDFRLDIVFTIDGPAIELRGELTNSGDRPLPASFGFHPALRWPLPFGGERDDHRIVFADAEAAPIRRIDPAGLLRPAPEPTPVEGDTLVARDALFEDDALIFDAVASRRLWWGVPGRRRLAIDFPDMPLLGIWTKPGAPYLCVEPWQGIADPEGFSGAFRDKPGVIEVAPGATRILTMRIAIHR